jgi:hypothetical protein
MRRPGALLVLAFLLSFGVGLLPRIPLRAGLRILPATLTCSQPQGALLSGRCQDLSLRLRSGPLSLGELSWSWRPWRLLRGRLAFDLSAQRGPVQASALLQFALTRIEVLDLSGQGPMDATLLRALPPGWSGEFEARGLRLRLEGDRLTALDGDLRVPHLRAAQGEAWGSYQLHIPRLPGGGLAPGTLRSLEGPVALQGTLRLKPDRSWQLDASVAMKPGSPAAAALDFLGPPDAQGMRPLSVSGSY